MDKRGKTQGIPEVFQMYKHSMFPMITDGKQNCIVIACVLLRDKGNDPLTVVVLRRACLRAMHIGNTVPSYDL